MKLDRRDYLKAGAAAVAGAMLSGCSQVVRRLTPPALPTSLTLNPQPAASVVAALNRITFGARLEDVARVATLGWEEFVEEQLSPEDTADTPAARWRPRSAELLHLNTGDLFNFKEHEVLAHLQQATILRAVYSRWQLREVMMDFWTNHFNIYARKFPCAYLLVSDQRDAIRPHVLGKFRDLLTASVHSAAMLTYLDNQANKKGTPNENYARELMELHTLGVHGGYTQRDVQEVARCFTGWTVRQRGEWRRGQFYFDATQHDDGAKTVLGVKIPAGLGQGDGERVIDILANHPSTARFIARKLCLRFLGDAPEEMVAQLAQVYRKTEGDLRAMLRSLLLNLHHTPSIIRPQIKRPFDFLVSALRALYADTDGGRALQQHLSAMGQPLFQWPMPDGYPQTTAAWTGSLLARWNFALALTAGEITGTQINLPALAQAGGGNVVDAFMTLLFHRPTDDVSLQPLRERLHEQWKHTQSPAQIVALMLASPQFQWK
ncbi:MAG: DUF1800 domain-containing protein [Abditibacteriales bacterium]|nr:DUF1800 domain-containing protein [Abditibacteriales bacterium]MDW8366410.1 DUF1800 domain-containing protein [Abditibacteriales bacterium]